MEIVATDTGARQRQRLCGAFKFVVISGLGSELRTMYCYELLGMTEKKWIFTPFVIEVAPEEPGIYVLWNDGETIYIGSTDNLRATLLGHAAGDPDPRTGIATHYGWETTDTPKARAAELRAAHHARHGGLPALNKPVKRR